MLSRLGVWVLKYVKIWQKVNVKQVTVVAPRFLQVVVTVPHSCLGDVDIYLNDVISGFPDLMVADGTTRSALQDVVHFFQHNPSRLQPEQQTTAYVELIWHAVIVLYFLFLTSTFQMYCKFRKIHAFNIFSISEIFLSLPRYVPFGIYHRTNLR